MGIEGIKIAFHTLGCKVNGYETEVMKQEVLKAGAFVVPFSEYADVYVINTCSVTNMADRKSRQMLRKGKHLNPKAVILCTGCYVESENREKLLNDGVDMLLGNNEKSRIAEVIAAYFNKENHLEIPKISEEKCFESMVLENPPEHTRAYIKIQDGCNQFCSYCIIPYTRGRVRSREMQEILNEATLLSEKGIQEIVLTGIHISSYGTDGKDYALIDLIEALEALPGIQRIRLGSLEPRVITEEFTKRLRDCKKICPHFHLSLQSGCEKTLKSMNRHYTPEEYAHSCDILQKYFEDPGITTDVIVGFPGETEEDFEISKAFLEKIGFFEMHIFKYSRRKGTRADKMENQVSEGVKTRRSHILLELAQKMSIAYVDRHIGKVGEILTEESEEIGETGYRCGYSKEYIRCALPMTYGQNEIVTGTFTERLENITLKVKSLER